MGIASDFSTRNELIGVLLIVGVLGGGFQGFQEGLNCTLKEISMEKPGNETLVIQNTGSLDVTLEIKKSSYDDGSFSFVGKEEQLVTIESGGEASISLEDGKIMQYKFTSCRAKSGLARYGEIDPSTRDIDVPDAVKNN